VEILYALPYTVRWSDLDANGHMRNTAYVECAIQARFGYFSSKGFTFEEFRKQQFGPVIFHEEIFYFKEIRMLENIRVTFHVSKLTDDGGRFTINNILLKEGDVKAAEVITDGAWLDLTTRKLRVPPVELAEVMRTIYIPPAAES
jgi:acyl-CoA thioester hydrolase